MKMKSFLCLGILAFLSLTGCNNKHVHKYDKENIEWQWTEFPSGGYDAKAILSCKSCDESTEGHYLEINADVTNKQTREPTCTTPGIILYTATMSYEGDTYSSTKEKQIYDADAHHFEEVIDEKYLKSPATCTEDAVYYKSCEYCFEKSEETFTAENTKLGHHLIHHEASSSTCQVHGNIEHYECDRCLKLFADESASEELDPESVILPLAHKMTYHPGVDATCTTDGSLGYYTCEYEEGVLYKDEEGNEKFNDVSELFVARFGHDMTLHEANDATCTEDGNLKYYTCSHEEGVYFKDEDGNETYNDFSEIVVEKLNHQIVHRAASSSTCQVHGCIDHYECERCHKLFSDENASEELTAEEVYLPLAHDMTHHAGTDPTCTEDGSKDYYTCSYEDGVLYKDEAGTEAYADASELVIDKLGHTFNESLNCIRGDTTMKEAYAMEDVSAVDTISPATVSTIGLTSGAYVPSGTSHMWGTYDYVSNGGIDLWIELSYLEPVGGTDYYALFYLFSDHGEGGIVFRFGLSRTENDGIIPCYIYTAADYSANPGTTVVQTAGASGTFFWLPRSSGVKSSTTNLLHLTAYCLDEDTNLFRCQFTAGVKGGTQYNVSTNPEDITNTAKYFDICLGANYFNGGVGRNVRISCNAPSNAKVIDTASEDKVVVYKDAAGNVVGKLNNQETAKAPSLVSENKTFLGWFDPQGHKVSDGDVVSTKKVITPRFVANQTNMFVPSDTLDGEFAAAKGGWYESTSFTGECGGQLPTSNVSNRFDVYFIYNFVSKSADDNYAIFGFPFDFLDGNTRIHLRIDNKGNGNLVNYIYGPATSLGGAGAAGTMFTTAGFRANNADLLIHMAVYNASADGLTLLVEIVNLGDGQVFQTTKDVTFSTPGLYAINNPARNVFDLMKANCEYRITDAF